MRPEDLRQVMRRRPFRPFRLHLLETTNFDIRHPEQLVVGHSTATIASPTPNTAIPIGEYEVIVALLHLTKWEPPPPAATPSVNGP
jgi:hypothetical protein